MMRRWIIPTLSVPLLATLVGQAASAPPASTLPDPKGIQYFETHVRPLLARHCYACHSKNTSKPQGGLSVDTRAGLLAGGAAGPAVVPGDPDKSPLIQAVRFLGKGVQMPPAGKLADRDIEVLVNWVKMGAPDPRGPVGGAPVARKSVPVEEGRKRWAFRKSGKISPPAVKAAAWVRNPIDTFILARLEGAGLKPNRYADRRTLIRRAYFDLIGLPPTPEEVQAFEADRSPDAWDKVIDRLLESPHYGERWARHWLDLARFAESHGFEHDYDRPNAYHYRDFVIKAFNQGMPYDQFVKWQIAGDEFAPENPLALAATGYLAAGTHSTQITQNLVEKERYDELDDMTATIGTSMLGLTFGCARCHDHKFDPISQKDYYRLVATFTKTVRSDFDVDVDPEGYRKAKAQWEADHAPLVQAREAFERGPFAAKLEQVVRERIVSDFKPAAWRVLDASGMKSAGGAAFTDLGDGSVLAGGKTPDNDTYTLAVRTDLPEIRAIRLEALAHPSFVKSGPGRASNGNFALSDFRVTAAPADGSAPPKPVTLVDPVATFEQPGLPIRAALDTDGRSGWAVDPQFGKDHAAIFRTSQPVGFSRGTLLTITLKFDTNTAHTIGRPRLSVSADPAAPLVGEGRLERVETVLQRMRGGATLTSAEREPLVKWLRTTDPTWQALDRKVQEHVAGAPKPRLQKMLISSEGVPAVRLHTQGGDFLEETHLLRRGDPNQKAEVVKQGFPEILVVAGQKEQRWQEAPPAGWRTPYQRRSLANWITDTENGAGFLLARVISNRLWQHHFGRGIVATPSDFGAQGEAPTHPELLDYLASVLSSTDTANVAQGSRGAGEPGRTGTLVTVSAAGNKGSATSTPPHAHTSTPGLGWSLKKLHKLIMTSAAYMQSSQSDPVKAKADPANKLVGRQSRRRLEAEIIRDAMLAVSGELDRTQFGPGTLDEGHKRRSIYFTMKRSKLIPGMVVFDAPDGLSGMGVRPTTTVAPQALLFLNSPHVRGYATSFARRIADLGMGNAARTGSAAVHTAYLRALGRAPNAVEAEWSEKFLRLQAASYQAAGRTDADLLALTDLAQTLFGLNEFIYVD